VLLIFLLRDSSIAGFTAKFFGIPKILLIFEILRSLPFPK
jgi:hypothetical protein